MLLALRSFGRQSTFLLSTPVPLSNVRTDAYTSFSMQGTGRIEVQYWLEKGQIVVDELTLSHKGLSHLPNLQDVAVKGHFYCGSNSLVTLEGTPENVEGD
jgi:hypothetical protein